MTVSEEGALTEAVRAGDEPAFTELAERYRRELKVHCYRMLGSFHDAEDLVQDTLLKAWQGRAGFAGRSSLRAWLYRIATNGCLDFLDARGNRMLAPEANPPGSELPPHVPWLEPYPDRLLDPAAPESAVISRETIELAFLVAIQFLPPKQRAVLILLDVLDWSAKEAAELLELSVPAVNSALQRARATLREHKPAREPDEGPDEQQRLLLERYVAATERCDVKALAALLSDDVRSSMPPDASVYAGRDSVVGSWVAGGFGTPPWTDFRCLVTRANRMPAVACYMRKPGEAEYRPIAVDVLRVEKGLIAEITTFALEPFVAELGLPPTL